MPRRGDIYIGPGNFREIGQAQVDLLIKLLDLRPDDAVLDIGSGIGRTALPLTRYLSPAATYHGFDVVEKGVDWCQTHLSTQYSNFHFTYVPLHNDLYNESSGRASHFTFPYPDRRFDKAFLFSVFSHMLVDEIANYLREIDRVLNADGRCLATFFLYNDRNAAQISTQEGFRFPYLRDGYRLLDEHVHSANIAIDEDTLEQLLGGTNLRVERIVEGYWKAHVGKNGGNDFQDLVVFTRKS